ncbi:TonB-dependent receptor plug domain-containing protein [Flavihumibacter fluvii]|uniref:TonB-dependent receptor plug domain-containing protein n=1 Tax=Flavihumibacter fluvii TaxID=2838157 RepID=UPI001BDE26FC|nr:TonB-dependent receptor [Flavihumibacter fluvii]ULQ52466.1 TonB-dependent receptor [Flavihumibacter fluvii]
MKTILTISLMGIAVIPFAQDIPKKTSDSNLNYLQLNEVVVSANRFSEKLKNVVQQITVISASSISRTNAQNTGDLLMSTGKVFVQKSQQGGSSPVLRGFEASRVLLVVDGVRMNNAIYRSGHLQNVITVDQNMLERTEIIFGPGSTLYGSDALGGVINFITKQPKMATGAEKNATSGSVFSRYSSANNENTGHFDINFGFRKIALLSSVTYSDFGDMQMGSRDHKDYPDFGRRFEYVDQIGYTDTIVQNNDPNRQRFSGYKQWDILQKLLYRPSDKTSHLLTFQYSNSDNVPRYDRLQDTRNGKLRYAEWYYGPQLRQFAGYTFNAENLSGFFNQVRATLSYQDIKESRQTREYRRYDRFDSRREQVKVYGAIIDARKVFGNNELSIGTDLQLNDVHSVADRTNLLTGATSKLDTRYPDGKNSMNYYGFFAQHTLKMRDGKWVLNDGLRLQFTDLHSTIEDNSFFNLPVTDTRQQNTAVTGNLGLIFIPDDATKISLGLSSGFRSPNIDDLAKVFESSTAAQQVVVPNPDLKPEYTYNVDLGISKLIAEKIKVEVTGFYTWFRNAIIKAPFTLNGQDSILYNGVQSQVLASQNVNTAYVTGLTATISGDLGTHFSFLSTLTLTKGRFKTDASKTSSIYQEQPDGSYELVQANVSSKPLDHIPPVFGRTSIQYRQPKWNLEAFAQYNGWKHLDKYNADGEDNAQYATNDGMPGWITYNLRGQVSLHRQIQLQVALENITDRNYRSFASGFSAPGRNLMIALRAQF